MYLSVKLLALAHHHKVSAGQQPTKSHTKKCSEIKNKCCQPYDFCGASDLLAGNTIHV